MERYGKAEEETGEEEAEEEDGGERSDGFRFERGVSGACYGDNPD